MPVTDTRVGPGTITFGAAPLDFSCQVSSAALVPDNAEDDVTATLCDPNPVAPVTTSWMLSGSAIQDFEDPDGFQSYCFNNGNATVDFEYIPNTDAGTVFTGEVLIVPIQIGGEVATQNAVDFEFQVKGTPVWGQTGSPFVAKDD